MRLQQYLPHYIFKQDSCVFATHFFNAEEMNQDCVVGGGYCVQNSTFILTEMGMCIVQRSLKNWIILRLRQLKLRLKLREVKLGNYVLSLTEKTRLSDLLVIRMWWGLDTFISVCFKANALLLIWRNIEYVKVTYDCYSDVKYAKY